MSRPGPINLVILQDFPSAACSEPVSLAELRQLAAAQYIAERYPTLSELVLELDEGDEEGGWGEEGRRNTRLVLPCS